MRACDIDVKNHVVEEYSMTWENVDDTFLSEKICFQNSMIPHTKKKKKKREDICSYSYACMLACISGLCVGWPVPPPGSSFLFALPSLGAHPHSPVHVGWSLLCLWTEVPHILTKTGWMCVVLPAQSGPFPQVIRNLAS